MMLTPKRATPPLATPLGGRGPSGSGGNASGMAIVSAAMLEKTVTLPQKEGTTISLPSLASLEHASRLSSELPLDSNISSSAHIPGIGEVEIVNDEWKYRDNHFFNFEFIVGVKEQRRIGSARTGKKATPQASAIIIRGKGPHLPETAAIKATLFNFGSAVNSKRAFVKPENHAGAPLVELRQGTDISCTDNIALFGPTQPDGWRYATLRCYITRGARVQCRKNHIALKLEVVDASARSIGDSKAQAIAEATMFSELSASMVVAPQTAAGKGGSPGNDEDEDSEETIRKKKCRGGNSLPDIPPLVGFPWVRTARISISEKAMCPRESDKKRLIVHVERSNESHTDHVASFPMGANPDSPFSDNDDNEGGGGKQKETAAQKKKRQRKGKEKPHGSSAANAAHTPAANKKPKNQEATSGGQGRMQQPSTSMGFPTPHHQLQQQQLQQLHHYYNQPQQPFSPGMLDPRMTMSGMLSPPTSDPATGSRSNRVSSRSSSTGNTNNLNNSNDQMLGMDHRYSIVSDGGLNLQGGDLASMQGNASMLMNQRPSFLNPFYSMSLPDMQGAGGLYGMQGYGAPQGVPLSGNGGGGGNSNGASAGTNQLGTNNNFPVPGGAQNSFGQLSMQDRNSRLSQYSMPEFEDLSFPLDNDAFANLFSARRPSYLYPMQDGSNGFMQGLSLPLTFSGSQGGVASSPIPGLHNNSMNSNPGTGSASASTGATGASSANAAPPASAVSGGAGAPNGPSPSQGGFLPQNQLTTSESPSTGAVPFPMPNFGLFNPGPLSNTNSPKHGALLALRRASEFAEQLANLNAQQQQQVLQADMALRRSMGSDDPNVSANSAEPRYMDQMTLNSGPNTKTRNSPIQMPMMSGGNTMRPPQLVMNRNSIILADAASGFPNRTSSPSHAAFLASSFNGILGNGTSSNSNSPRSAWNRSLEGTNNSVSAGVRGPIFDAARALQNPSEMPPQRPPQQQPPQPNASTMSSEANISNASLSSSKLNISAQGFDAELNLSDTSTFADALSNQNT